MQESQGEKDDRLRASGVFCLVGIRGRALNHKTLAVHGNQIFSLKFHHLNFNQLRILNIRKMINKRVSFAFQKSRNSINNIMHGSLFYYSSTIGHTWYGGCKIKRCFVVRGLLPGAAEVVSGCDRITIGWQQQFFFVKEGGKGLVKKIGKWTEERFRL